MEYERYQKNSNSGLREQDVSKKGVTGYAEREKEKKEHAVSKKMFFLDNVWKMLRLVW